MGATEGEAFLAHLATERNVSAAPRNQAKAALLFLYRETLQIDLRWIGEATTANVGKRPPVTLTRREVRALLDELNGTMRLVASLLHGTGTRALEGLWLRVKDVEFERREIVIRAGAGDKPGGIGNNPGGNRHPRGRGRQGSGHAPRRKISSSRKPAPCTMRISRPDWARFTRPTRSP
jgi:integrase